MRDLIERQAAIDAIENEQMKIMRSDWAIDQAKFSAMSEIRALIAELPSVSTEKTGHWILLDECSNSGYYCSECHKKVVKEGWSKTVKKIKFCPNCGAKMIELQESKESDAENLCDSCKTKGCIFQSGIVRSHCDFYKGESEDA